MQAGLILLAGQRTAEAVNHASDRLVAFERGTYNLNEELSRLSESGINDLREQLSADNKECSEKIKTLLHQHYRAFISASKVKASILWVGSWRFSCILSAYWHIKVESDMQSRPSMCLLFTIIRRPFVQHLQLYVALENLLNRKQMSGQAVPEQSKQQLSCIGPIHRHIQHSCKDDLMFTRQGRCFASIKPLDSLMYSADVAQLS